MSATQAMRPRVAASEAPPPSPLIDTSTVSPPVAAMADIVNDVAAPFQSPPDPAKGTLGAIEHGIGAVMGVVGAPFELMDTGFALATSSVAALMPGFPAATLTGPHLGMLHGHLHPPSLIPPAVVPIPLPSIGNILCSGAPAVLVGGLPAARAGDVGLAVLCFSTSPAFEVYTGSSNTFIGGSRAARMLDITRHCNPVSALGKLGAAFGAVGVAAGAIGAGASANAGDATQASILAKQAAADAAALAMSALLGKDPGIPPSMGAVMAGNPTVLVGGFPMPDLMDLLGGLLKGLKKLGALAGMSPSVRKAFAKIGLCNSPGEPVDSFTGVVYNDFEDYRDPRGFVWERHYRSSWNEESGPLGYGFRHFYQRRLTLLRKEVVYEAHDGEQALIPRASGGGFVVGGGFRLEEGGPGNYVLYTDRDEVLDFVELPTLPRSARLSRYRAQGVELSLTYDDVGRLTRLTEVGHGEPLDTTLRYDVEGRIVELRRGNRHGEARTISRYTYDEGCLVTWQDALGGTARMLYDARHRMIRGTDRRGYSFHWEYDVRTGRCVRGHGDDGLWGIEASYAGTQSVFREPDGGEWLFKHFPDGVVSHRVDPEGGLLEYVRDDGGRIVEQVLPGGRRFAWFYDDDGQHYGRADGWGNQFAPEDEDPEPDDPFEHDGPLGAREWLWGRPLADLSERPGLLTSVIAKELEQLGPWRLAALPPVPEPRRDLLGRPLESVGPSGVIERYEYDAEGNVLTTQDCHGNVWRRQVTSWNLLGAETTPLGHTTRYEYTHREDLRALVDPLGNRTEYRRDGAQRVREERRRGALWRAYRHDPNDIIVEERDARGVPLRIVLIGSDGLPSEQRLASGEVYRFRHDGRGRPILASSNLHEVALENLRELRVADRRDGAGVEHAYESWLGIRRTTYFDRFVVDYDYGSGPGVSIRTPDGRQHRVYGGGNGLVVRHNANGTNEATVFDSEQRLCSRSCWHAERAHVGATWTQRYRYSEAGELELCVDGTAGPTQLEYDADRRVVRLRGASGELAYEYDAADNLTSAPGAEVIEYDEGHRVRRANIALYQHDEQARRSCMQRPFGATVHYEYDSRGQLLRVTWSDRSEVWTAAYDGLGRRLWREYGGARTDFYWDGDRLAAERAPEGRLRLYCYVNEDALVPFCFIDYASGEAEPGSGTPYYVYAAPTGMPLRVEDQNRTVVWQVETLHPYGRIELARGAKIDLRLRFAGHYHDEHLELHYNRYRDYDPLLGRYLQPDPIGHAGGVNLYAYPRNPVVDVDLLGLFHKAKRKAKKRSDQREKRAHRAKKRQVKAAVKKRAEQIHANASRGERKAQVMVAGVRDKKTGKVFLATNADASAMSMDDLHPVIRRRVAAQDGIVRTNKRLIKEGKTPDDIHKMSDADLQAELRKDGVEPSVEGMDTTAQLRRTNERVKRNETLANRPMSDSEWKGFERESGKHGEVKATSDALHARGPDATAEDLKDLELHNQRLPSARSQPLSDEAMPRCQHCRGITDGVEPSADLKRAEQAHDAASANRWRGME